MNEEMILTTLAALLHDVGRVAQRANGHSDHTDFRADLLNKLPAEVIAAIRNHHQTPQTRRDYVLQAADWLASGEERRDIMPATPQPELACLIPPTARVALLHERPTKPLRLSAVPLSLEQEAIFPRAEPKADYPDLQKQMDSELARIPSFENRAGVITLLAVLRKYTSLIPHTATGETDEAYPTQADVSLFDHLKLTGAIAACLLDETQFDDATLAAIARNETTAMERPIARLVRGEFSGIQDFIYRITRAEAEEKGGTARRLRGRSFYVSLLVEVITDWLVRRLDLTPANILFCGGGRFDLLIPNGDTEKIRAAEAELNAWLLKKFAGELSVEMVYDVSVRGQDCRDFSDVYRQADDRLATRKQQKLHAYLEQDWFYLGYNEPQDNVTQAASLHALCPACHSSPMKIAGKLCDECDLQAKIGQWLPKPDTQFLTFIYGEEPSEMPEKIPRIPFAEPFSVTVALLNRVEADACLEEFSDREIVISRLNDTKSFILGTASDETAFDFKFLGNAAPVAKKDILLHQSAPHTLEKDHVFDFGNIAELLTTGAHFLGVLKMDIDNLGMLFSRGLDPKTLARVSALSRSLDLFFCGWLNQICQALTNEWKENNAGKQDWTDSLFYVVYSGGDDMLIVGPWDQMIGLAQRIRADFGQFTGDNPSVTLSGGAVLVKPHFPVHRFAPLVDEELKQSKSSANRQQFNKDRFTIFRQTLPWHRVDNEPGLDEVMAFAHYLEEKVKSPDDPIPKSLLYFLLRLYDQYLNPHTRVNLDRQQGPLWIPKFNYAVARRVSAQTGLELVAKVHDLINHIRLPISYVSLKTRKE